MNRTTAARRSASRVRSLRAVWAGRTMCRKYRTAVMSILTKLNSAERLRLWSPFSCTRSSASSSSRSSSNRIRPSSSAFRQGPQLSTLEIVYWVVGIASLPLCWYFNIRFVQEYADEPDLGPGQLDGVHRAGIRESRGQFAGCRLHDHEQCDPVAAVHDRRRPATRHQAPVAVLRDPACSPASRSPGRSTWRPSNGSADTNQ